MTRQELYKEIHNQTGVPKSDVQNVLDLFLQLVQDEVCRGEQVTLRGFGGFFPQLRKAKTARDINNNTTMVIPARRMPVFKPSKTFLERVQQECPVEDKK